jgi:hypothetical protein
MLGRDKNVIDAEGSELAVLVGVLNDDLGLAVRSQPWDLSVLPLDGHLLAELVGELMGQRMESFLVPLVGGIAEHETLVTSADISIGLVGVDSSEDVCILGLDVGDYLAVCSIESDGLTGVADLGAHIAGDLLEVDLVSGHSGFSEKNNHSSFDRGLHGDLGIGVNSEACIDDAVGDLITELVGMSLADRL